MTFVVWMPWTKPNDKHNTLRAPDSNCDLTHLGGWSCHGIQNKAYVIFSILLVDIRSESLYARPLTNIWEIAARPNIIRDINMSRKENL